VKDLS
ncbi:ABC transporter ATP-binding protein uup, partial [Vibrio harveyi]